MSFDKERLEKQMAFIREIDKEKQIFRQSYVTDGTRKENDAEHAWHMAIMTFLLSEYANEEIDVLKTIRMILIHDIVEIDAGDTYAYDDSAKATQKEREERAANRLFGLLPEDQAKDLRSLWDEFEAGETKEAKFARTMDNVQPLLLNDATGGECAGGFRQKLQDLFCKPETGCKDSRNEPERSFKRTYSVFLRSRLLYVYCGVFAGHPVYCAV